MGCACRRGDDPARSANRGCRPGSSALDHLAACEQELQLLEAIDPSLLALRQACTDGLAQLQDLARDLDRYGASLESDPETLASCRSASPS